MIDRSWNERKSLGNCGNGFLMQIVLEPSMYAINEPMSQTSIETVTGQASRLVLEEFNITLVGFLRDGHFNFITAASASTDMQRRQQE